MLLVVLMNSLGIETSDPFHPIAKYEFLKQLRSVRGRSENTILAYRRDIDLFEQFWLDHKDLDQLFHFLKSKGLSERSQARVTSSLRTFFKYCSSVGLPVPDTERLKAPVVFDTAPKTALTAAQFFRLLQSAELEDDQARTDRNKVTLYLLYSLGIKVSEMISLNLDDVNLNRGFIVVRGKTKTERSISLNETLVTALRHYVEDVRESLITRGITPSLLINDRGRRPSRVDIWRWLAAWSTSAGFDSPLGPQAFRHGCALALKDSGFDIEFLKSLLGHKYSQTTAEFYFGQQHCNPSQKTP